MALWGEAQFGTLQWGASAETDTTIEVNRAELDLLGFAPETEHRPGSGTLTFTGLVPQAIQGFVIEVPTATPTLTGQAPAALLNERYNVPAGTMTITGLAPEEIITGVPTQYGFTFTGYAPTFREFVNLPWDITYSLRGEYTFVIEYGIAGLTEQTQGIVYDINNFLEVEKPHLLTYDMILETAHEIAYGFTQSVSHTHSISYDMQNNVQATHGIQYDILSYNPVEKRHRQIYSILTTSVINITGEVKVII